MADHSGNKQSIYIKDDMLDEITAEAKRLDRSISWVLAHLWKRGSSIIKQMPGVDEFEVKKGKK